MSDKFFEEMSGEKQIEYLKWLKKEANKQKTERRERKNGMG